MNLKSLVSLLQILSYLLPRKKMNYKHVLSWINGISLVQKNGRLFDAGITGEDTWVFGHKIST